MSLVQSAQLSTWLQRAQTHGHTDCFCCVKVGREILFDVHCLRLASCGCDHATGVLWTLQDVIAAHIVAWMTRLNSLRTVCTSNDICHLGVLKSKMCCICCVGKMHIHCFKKACKQHSRVQHYISKSSMPHPAITASTCDRYA